MAIVARQRRSGIVYYVTFDWHGKEVWERIGAEKREAQRVAKLRRREVAEGTYVPQALRKATLVGQFLQGWLERRTNHTADKDRSWLRNHVLNKEWFTAMPLEDVRPRHILQLIEELKKTNARRGGEPLAPKSVSNIYTPLRTAFRDARILELITSDPCAVPKGTISKRTKKRKGPYEKEDIRELVRNQAVEALKRVYCALLFFTGMRLGEAAGRRWRHWSRSVKPLGSMSVGTQYKDLVLKTEHHGDDRPREVPVHPELARILTWWWNEGFEMTFRRKPRESDFIVPMATDVSEPQTPSSAYRILRTACKRTGVELRGVHSSRRSFISLARRAGARTEIVEYITHNASGRIIDVYTFWDWKPLCDAVLCVNLDEVGPDATPDASTDPAENKWSRGGSNPQAHEETSREAKRALVGDDDPEPPKSRGFRSPVSKPAARQECPLCGRNRVFVLNRQTNQLERLQ